MENYKNKDWLYNEYIILLKSMKRIAREQGMGNKKIKSWLKIFDIKIRLHNEATHLAECNHVNLTTEATEFLSGELLGDGCLQSRSQWSADYLHSSKHKEYIDWLSETFNGFGIKQAGKTHETINKQLGNVGYHYASLSYPELLPLQQKWYRPYNPETDIANWQYKYIKIVPTDIKLTPLVCRQWYIGDGSLHHQKYKEKVYNYIRLSVMCFSVTDIEFLVGKLHNIGFESHWTKQNEIYVSAESTPLFLDYIGKCPIKCYEYKWKLKK